MLDNGAQDAKIHFEHGDENKAPLWFVLAGVSLQHIWYLTPFFTRLVQRWESSPCVREMSLLRLLGIEGESVLCFVTPIKYYKESLFI